MKSDASTKGIEVTWFSRLDVIAFVAAFLTGFILYVGLHVVFQLSQWIVTVAILLVMCAYALVAIRVPRLRVRLDQAGDNAYYLGLLFTLISMAFALYEFGAAMIGEGAQPPARSGAQQIIENFGIALFSTIAGIFLRVILHEMRVDPAEVESMARIELVEASKRVRASIDTVTSDLGRFHDEVQQRSRDVLTTLVEDTKTTVSKLYQELEHTTKEMLVSVGNTQMGVLERTEELTRVLGETAQEALKAIERLRAVEPPPLTLSRRLEKVGKVLESVGDQSERTTSQLERISDSAATAMEGITRTSIALGELAQQMRVSHAEITQTIAGSVERISSTLDSFGKAIEKESQLLAQLEEQSKRSVEESARAQVAAVEVLTRLTEVTRGLTALLKQAK